MAISLMVAAYDEDECLLITSPEQLEHVDARAVSAVLMDDIFGSGSLDENLFMRWQTLFEDVSRVCVFSILYIIPLLFKTLHSCLGDATLLYSI